MVENLKWTITIENVRAMAGSALGTLQALDDELIGVEGEEAEHVCDEVKRTLRAVEDMNLAIDAWLLAKAAE
jgi:hypothetical protein